MNIAEFIKYVGLEKLSLRKEGMVYQWSQMGFEDGVIYKVVDECFVHVNRLDFNYIDRKLSELKSQGILTLEQFTAQQAALKSVKERFSKCHEVEFFDFHERKIRFKSNSHEAKYCEIIWQMKSKDVYHKAVAYLLSLDTNICDNEERLKACFDFEGDSICRKVLDEPWITGTDRRILTLAFNLWNENNRADVSDVFCSSDDLDCLLEAVRIRFV